MPRVLLLETEMQNSTNSNKPQKLAASTSRTDSDQSCGIEGKLVRGYAQIGLHTKHEESRLAKYRRFIGS